MKLLPSTWLLPLIVVGASEAAGAAPTGAALLAQPPRSSGASSQPRPAPAPVRPVAPVPSIAVTWPDMPLSPGRWTYQRARGPGARALFGLPSGSLLAVACEPGRQISITRGGGTGSAFTIRTSSLVRTLPAAASAAGLRAQLAAGDPLLDAIAFSRGRFAVETAGAFPLIIPNWPELARVVEDCRR